MAAPVEAIREAGSAGRVIALLRDGGRRGRCSWLRPAASAPPSSPLPPPPRSARSRWWCSRYESVLLALDMAAVAATAATRGNGSAGGRAGAGEASGARKKKGPGPLATAYLVIYNVVMTAG